MANHEETVQTTLIVVGVVIFVGADFVGCSVPGWGVRAVSANKADSGARVSKRWYVVHAYSGYEKQANACPAGTYRAFGFG